VAVNENGIKSQSCELSKELKTSCTDVALLSQTHLKPHKRFFVRNYHIYRNDCHSGAKAGNPVAVRKGVRYNYVDLPPLISIEATGFCTTLDKKEILLAVVYKYLIKD